LKTQSQNNSQDDASVDTTVVSNAYRQETNVAGMSMITGLSDEEADGRNRQSKGSIHDKSTKNGRKHQHRYWFSLQ
jgi:hypothetical protein